MVGIQFKIDAFNAPKGTSPWLPHASQGLIGRRMLWREVNALARSASDAAVK
jgi:hypothetical protein